MDNVSEKEVKSDVSQLIFRCGQSVTYTAVHLKIANYRQLEENVEYERKLDRPNWYVRLSKTKKKFDITIITEQSFGDISYVVSFNNGIYSKELCMKQADGGRSYTSRLPLNLVEVPENEPITYNALDIQFRLDARKCKRISPYICTSLNYSEICMEALSQNMLTAIFKEQFKNFTMKRGNQHGIRLDKSVLAARCRILEQSPKYKYANEIEVEVKSKKVLKLLMTYMYTGSIKASRQNLLHLYHLAKRLVMRSLMTRIAKLLLESIEPSEINRNLLQTKAER